MIKPIFLVVRGLGVLHRGGKNQYNRRFEVKRHTSYRKSKKTVRKTLSAVPDMSMSEFCSLCSIVFGSNEDRVLVDDKQVHLRCNARRLVT